MTSTVLWTLIAIQIAMGAFDTAYHHELTERLAWRPSQRRELQLHAARNVLYAVLFLTLGFAEVHGAFAWLLLGLLGVEVAITLADFVEEDLSRKLPATERINHALLTLNYGAILTLLIPILIAWAKQDTSIELKTHGLWSALAVLSAFGVIVFCLRDLYAAARTVRLGGEDPRSLAAALPARTRVLVTGATGFIGSRLVEVLAAGGHDVTVLVRDGSKALGLRAPLRIVTALTQLDPATRIDAIVNLAGEAISNGLWTARKRDAILGSRIAVTQAVLALIQRLETKPDALVSGSAVGWYGLRGNEVLTETSTAQPCFSHSVCDAWEGAARGAEASGVRVVLLRTGLVLDPGGGLLSRVLAAFEFGLGGRMGSGMQWMSWIARDDLVRLIAHAIATPRLAGPLNATAPTPVTNACFTAALARALRRPAFLHLPGQLLGFLGGSMAKELLLGGQRVIPEKAMASGFVFRYPRIGRALPQLLGQKTAAVGEKGAAALEARTYRKGMTLWIGLRQVRAGWPETRARRRDRGAAPPSVPTVPSSGRRGP